MFKIVPVSYSHVFMSIFHSDQNWIKGKNDIINMSCAAPVAIKLAMY